MNALSKKQLAGFEARLQQDRDTALGSVQEEIRRTSDPDELKNMVASGGGGNLQNQAARPPAPGR